MAAQHRSDSFPLPCTPVHVGRSDAAAPVVLGGKCDSVTHRHAVLYRGKDEVFPLNICQALWGVLLLHLGIRHIEFNADTRVAFMGRPLHGAKCALRGT